MAIYHLRAKAVGRAIKNPKPGGATRRSAVAAAAYRSGERLFDSLQGKWFTRRADPDHAIEHTAILAPEGAPAVVLDRVQLWNLVERREMNVTTGKLRENAQLYREVEVTLPRELSREARIALIEDYVREQFVSRGMIADIAIHNKTGSDGQQQPHAHIMLTMRRLETDGAKIAAGHLFGAKAREWNMPDSLYEAIAKTKQAIGRLEGEAKAHGLSEERQHALETARERLAGLQEQMPLVQWRKAWAEAANAALEAAQQAARIDHRTLKAQREEALAQGDFVRAALLDREPQKPMGIMGRIQRAYEQVRENVHTWAAVDMRQKMEKAFGYLGARDPARMTEAILKIQDWTEGIIARFNREGQDRDMIPEVRYER